MVRSGKVALLIVEDDASVRFLMQTAAHRSGLFEPVLTAEDGQAAWDLLATMESARLPDLIVSDLSMPNMTGLELARAVKNDLRLRSIPIAIITSSDAPSDRDVALKAGVCAFVSKPFGLDALVRALTAIRGTCVEATTAASA